ncbi:major facilitator superfamily domain-containing protein [Ilyonectria robusta]|uniref:major facilitator superfamily domain-containing protein n=1 Tax=Ilyonectria robusta TaxID=1079257 RepID=UPI001E8E96CA|nr:major facilitator superfamily domain-containing protein [Ilyonectria robusta]KAH8652987.1 major facilitator superfamily domain-containing protein [Ilyonectria robusta]
MPFGIIDVRTDVPLTGTELLIRHDRPEGIADGDSNQRQLKRVMHRGIEIILIPQPSDNDPNDPLLWPRWKKETAFAVLFMNNIIFAAVPAPLLAAATYAVSVILNVSITKVSQLSGYQLLIVAVIGPLVSVFAQKYGKRLQFLLAAIAGTLGTVVCIIGSQKMSYSTLLAGRMIQGLGSTAWESLSLAAIGDMFYLHERGFRTALTVATLTCSTSLVSIIAGVLTERCGWKAVFIAVLPFNAVGLLGAIFFLPETQYRRSLPAATDGADASFANPTKSNGQEVSIIHNEQAQTTKAMVGYWGGLMAWSGTYSDRSILILLGEIFIHLINPAVIWILLVSGVIISLYVGTAYITAQIWTPPPYLLTVSQNGYFYAGSFIGGVLATVAGPICDWMTRLLSRLNGGVFEAEFRIPANIIGIIFSALGWFMFMWVVDNPRPDGYYLGAFFYGVACVGCSFPATVASLYILDSFPKDATEIFILQMMVKNFMFYAFSTFVNDWVARAGPGRLFQTWGIVACALIATSIPMYIFGKVNRKFYSKHKILKSLV